MKILLLVPVLLAAVTLPKPAPQPIAGEHDWTVDSVHSTCVFRVKMHGDAAVFLGMFDTVEGAITLDPTKPADGKIAITIPVDSVHTHDAKRDGHLKGPDFFSAKENPTIEFHSTKIEKKGDSTFAVTGDLAMAGKSHSVTVQVNRIGEGDFYGKRVGWETEFSIKRSDYGMTYGMDKNALGDEVKLMVAIETVQAK